jgi:hypothetical protein
MAKNRGPDYRAMARPSVPPVASVLALTVVAMISFVVTGAVAGWFVAGPACPLEESAYHQPYCAEPTTLQQSLCRPGYYCPVLWGPPPGFQFRGVTFNLTFLPPVAPNGTASVAGTITEPGGVLSRVFLLGDPLGPPVVNWTSVDRHVIIEWAAPFSAAGSDGLNATIVLCSVLLTPSVGSES